MHQKGISPLVASVLLIVMVVAISAFIITSTTSLIKDSTGRVENKTQTITNCAGASIKIDDVYLTNGTTGMARVQVRNDGSNDDMTIVSAQLFNTTGYNFTANGLPITGFDRGELVIINFANISVPLCNAFSKVTVVADCPEAYDTYAKAPRC